MAAAAKLIYSDTTVDPTTGTTGSVCLPLMHAVPYARKKLVYL